MWSHLAACRHVTASPGLHSLWKTFPGSRRPRYPCRDRSFRSPQSRFCLWRTIPPPWWESWVEGEHKAKTIKAIISFSMQVHSSTRWRIQKYNNQQLLKQRGAQSVISSFWITDTCFPEWFVWMTKTNEIFLGYKSLEFIFGGEQSVKIKSSKENIKDIRILKRSDQMKMAQVGSLPTPRPSDPTFMTDWRNTLGILGFPELRA